jgi:Putative MetA-pathway of phenol degradation
MSGGSLCYALLLLACAGASAQELEPQSYSDTTPQINFVAAGYVRSDGAVLFDTSAPISDVQAGIDSVTAVYGGTATVFGHTGSYAVVAPYAWADVSGNVGEASGSVQRSGPADLRVRIAMDLRGRQALPLIGASLAIIAPTGQYESSRVINIGSNRWSFRPEIGMALPRGRWLFETSLGAWFFTDNDAYFGGRRREQDSIASIQVHVSYSFRPGWWIAASSTYYRGGRTTLGGIENDDLQGNSRVGAVLSAPLTAHQSLKLAWSSGVSTRFGGDFDTWGVFWQYAWVRKH